MKIIITEDQYKDLTEKLTLSNFDEYAAKVTEAYIEAKSYDSAAVKHWNSLNKSNYDWWNKIIKEAKIVFVSGEAKYEDNPSKITINGKDFLLKYLKGGEPYATASEMSASFKRDKVLYIMVDYSDHPVWSVVDNIIFRTVHDYIVHIKGNFEFGLRGELGSYNLHAKLAPNDALPALFTEIVGQACHAVTKGGFPEQKIAVLDQFDFINVGVMKSEKNENDGD